jgi:class 3 adenylate cyclase
MPTRERTHETERRVATALFIDLSGFTEFTNRRGAEEAYRLVIGLLAIFDEVAREHGGTVERHVGDALLAVFGVPFAIENAPRAAINAAIEMHERVEAYNREKGISPPFGVHTGIETGLMISGDVEGTIHREFSVLGDPVNIAARLKDRAPRGSIWVGVETQRATRDDFAFKSVGALELKGIDEPVATFELLSRRPRVHRPRPGERRELRSPLVGRNAEMDRLRRVLVEVEAGPGAIVTLIGDAGSGKSRLVAELGAAREARPIHWIEGRALPTAANLSFHPFADLLGCWLGLGERDPSGLSTLDAALHRQVGDGADELAPFLASLMGLELDASSRERIAGIEGEAMERLIVRSMLRLLPALARKEPVALVFEDVHWADGSSVELLASLLRLVEEHRILFLLVARPGYEATAGRLQALARERHGARHVDLDLEPLDPEASAALVENLFAGGRVARGTRDLIELKTAGNPFFVEEVLRSLVDQGALEWRGGALFETERSLAVQIPGSVREVIMARVDRLDPAARRVLNVASVVGMTSDLDVLAAIVGGEELEQALGPLLVAELVVRRERRGRSRIAFNHPLVQEVAYDTLLQATRAELHLRVAETMESALAAQTPGRAGMLAYHFGQGADPERAEGYLFQAGDEAARIAASSEALHFFREAARLYLALRGDAAEPSKRALLEKKIALALFHRGRFLEANEHFDRALELLGERVARGRVALGLSFAWALALVLLELYRPRRGPRPAATEQQSEVFDLMLDRARVEATANPRQFFLHCMEGLRRLRSFDHSSIRRLGVTYAAAGGIFAFSGRAFGASARFLERAERTIDARDARELFFLRLMGFTHALLSGAWSRERAVDADLVAECLRYGQLWDVTTYRGLEQHLQVHQGRFREAAANLEELAKLEDLYGYDLASSYRQFGQAILMREQRRLDEALAAIELYLAGHDEPALNLLGLGTRAEIQVLRGDLAGARASVERAGALRRRAGSVPPFHANAPVRARFLLDVSELEAEQAAGRRGRAWRARWRARRSGWRARRAARRLAWDRPTVARLEAVRLWLCGRRRAALRCFRRALAEAEALDMRPELARIQLEIGRRLGTEQGPGALFEGRSAAAWTAAAKDLLHELGLRVREGPDPARPARAPRA